MNYCHWKMCFSFRISGGNTYQLFSLDVIPLAFQPFTLSILYSLCVLLPHYDYQFLVISHRKMFAHCTKSCPIDMNATPTILQMFVIYNSCALGPKIKLTNRKTR